MNLNKKKIIYSFLILLAIGLAAVLFFYFYTKEEQTANVPNEPQTTPINSTAPEVRKDIYPPIDNAKGRITKKPFGIYVTPSNSPVQPEKFSGYHTGTDFEATPDELTQEIPIFAICNGQILAKRIVSGYGGVIIQTGEISGQTVTVLYGHINTAQSEVNVGDPVAGNQKIAVLGDDKSYYTDGERKHLHLGIHKGGQTVYSGYVRSQPELADWIDIAPFL